MNYPRLWPPSRVTAADRPSIPMTFVSPGRGIAEIKRMYSRPGSTGVGTAILVHLESEAARMGYDALWLETRAINERAVRFYERRGYSRIPNYGKYIGNPNAVCFEKRLIGS